MYQLKVAQEGAPYLIEYPDDVMEAKIKFLTDLIFERTGIRPVSHRAGRWATNEKYFELLSKYFQQWNLLPCAGVSPIAGISGNRRDVAPYMYRF